MSLSEYLTDDYSPRASAVNLRTYARPTRGGLESFAQIDRRSTVDHHRRIAEGVGKTIPPAELEELYLLSRMRRSWVAGRTRWLGGTDYAFSRACSQFNCSALVISTVFDLVDATWLLLNGCGVGFRPQMGTLHGFPRRLNVRVVPSTRTANEKGPENNEEWVQGTVWTIKVGDSAKAWAKAIGKLFIPPPGVETVVIDGCNCRGPGERLSGYGWICNGFQPLADAMGFICGILNRKAGELLDDMDILDVINHVGTILSSRRSAQIALMDAGNPKAGVFAGAKREYWLENPHRRQSNNTLQFWSKPSPDTIEELLHFADECGGDPGIANMDGARKKCPWATVFNPCAEILLADKGFCNLVTNCLPRFRGDFAALCRAVYVIARANYRQTCVSLQDGVLQPAWHQTNEALRLCGVSLTGVLQADWLTDYQIRTLRNIAVAGAYSQADEWGYPRPKAVTTIKPEGTASKAMGSRIFGEVTEGIHRPLGRYVFNWVNYSRHDPAVELYDRSGYRVIPNPSDENNVLVCFPVEYTGVRFDRVGDKEVNLEPATAQLDRYLRFNNLWADHNVSCTVSYSPGEIPEMVRWLDRNWDNGFIAVSFLRRTDPTKTAKDLGHPYLPQEVVTAGMFGQYQQSLRPVDLSALQSVSGVEDDCPTGVCPAR